MFEKVNPSHPDKIADRIAGAIVDYAYTKVKDPKIAVEVLIGHGECSVVTETSIHIPYHIISGIVGRIAGNSICVRVIEKSQDLYLARNQIGKIRCGDNGIFKGVPVTKEQKVLTNLVNQIYERYPYDGKYILAPNKLIVCQSHVSTELLKEKLPDGVIINPLGDWTGGTDVDSGAANRKLGSDMGDSVTGGGLHGKDLSKADVSINIYAWIEAQRRGKPVELYCAIGDEEVDGKSYNEIVEIAREYIRKIGGFERFAEWGLIRPGKEEWFEYLYSE